MKKLFLDTNVVIDLLEKRAPFYKSAIEIFTMAYNKKVKLYISPMTYATASYLLRRHGAEGVKQLLSNFRQLSRVSTANEQTVDASLASRFDDFEDALQYYSAVKCNADVIITRNCGDFKYSRIPVMEPSEYLAALI